MNITAVRPQSNNRQHATDSHKERGEIQQAFKKYRSAHFAPAFAGYEQGAGIEQNLSQNDRIDN
jgi:hypothetical protein